MHSMSQALKSHLASETPTICNLWKITRQDGVVVGYTDFDQDIFYSGVQYYSLVAFTASAIKTNLSLSVDNLELKGPLGGLATTITDSDISNILMMNDDDVKAGLWDYALVDLLVVNHEDLTMGHWHKKTGNIGQITTGRVSYTAEFRGIQQPLSQQVIRRYTGLCAANFGDSNCRVDKSKFTFNGSVTSTIDQHSWVDTNLNQSNSTYIKGITAATQTNPIKITCPSHGLQAGEKVTLSQVQGMTQLNGLTLPIVYNDANTFWLNIDGTVFSAYTGGGIITKTVVSEYFKYGQVIWITGANAGIKAEVKTYRPNYVMLNDAMVFPIQVGDTYQIIAGCDKLMSTCNSRFSNRINFYGFNLVPGMDKLQAGEGS